jgi:chromosome segregation ATPase
MPMEKLAEFYGVVIRVVAEKGIDYASEQLEKMMPIISKKGSHDDVSIAFWLDYKDVLPLSKTILSLRLNSLECDSRKQKEDKKEAENRRDEIAERAKQLKDESGVYERKRAELEQKMNKVKEDKRKAEEDFNTATFLYEDAKKNLDQVQSVFDDLEKLASENEKAFESHRHEVCRADEMFKQIEKEIQAFEDRVSQDLEEMTNIQKILISFV